MQIQNNVQHDLQRCIKNKLFLSVTNVLLGHPTISLHLLSLWSELILKLFGFSRMITKREQKKTDGCGFTLSETHRWPCLVLERNFECWDRDISALIALPEPV